MNLDQFEFTIIDLFTKELLEEHEGDYGFVCTSNNSVSRVGYCTNLTLETIEQAIKNKVDLMITHHDAWGFMHGLRDDCVEKLQENNISHFFIHGPLDFVEFGTCTSLMNILGIDTIKQYSPYKDGDVPGIGELSNPVSFSLLVNRMRDELNEPVRAWKHNQKDIKRVGVLTGAGNSTDHIRQALHSGCDTYITGEASLYTIQYAQYVGINLLVGSHTFTEIYGVESLVKRIKEIHTELELIQLHEPHFELNH
ncbi:MAG: Nif3-like dinuclear metal center hexameric protein [Paenisporosarcina sp.]